MQKIFVIILFFGLISCSNSDDRNPFLPNIPIDVPPVFLNNPSNNNLLAVGGWVEINGGIKGIVVYHASINNYLAYDLACPHYDPSDCTKMTVDGLNMICTCDNSKFALALGGAPQSGTPYAARQYNVVKSGNTLIITN